VLVGEPVQPVMSVYVSSSAKEPVAATALAEPKMLGAQVELYVAVDVAVPAHAEPE